MITQTQQLETRSGNFNVAVYGDANASKTIIFCNSLGSNLEMWQAQAQALADEFRVVCYDQRGHGGTAHREEPCTLQHLADDVVSIMDALSIRSAVVCGLSMGGLTALQLALSHPDRADGIIVSNTATKFVTPEFWQTRKTQIAEGQAAAMKELAQPTAELCLSEEYRNNNPQAALKLTEYFSQTSPETYAACCDVLGQTDLADEIGKIELPTLIIAGTKDQVATVEQAQAMHQRIKNSTVVNLEAAHLSNIEAADAFTDAVRNYVEKLYD